MQTVKVQYAFDLKKTHNRRLYRFSINAGIPFMRNSFTIPKKQLILKKQSHAPTVRQ